MGLTTVKLKIYKDADSTQSHEEDFLVDSGAIFTLAPAKVLESLGVKPRELRVFTLANGEQISRKMGEAYFELGGKGATSKVIFGEEGDHNLLGVLTLEALEVVLDPMKRELRPLPMLLM